jgi:hypothetical protein
MAHFLESQKDEQIGTVSFLPSASLILENIGFVYPFYVYDCRPLAPILRQRPCSLMYDVN